MVCGVGQDDERRQVLVLAAQTVADPGAHAGEAAQRKPGVHLSHGGHVVGAVGDHRLDEREFVGTIAQMRQQAAHPQSTLTVPAELERTPEEVARLAEKSRHIERFAVSPGEFGFVVQGVDVAHAAHREDLDHSLGSRSEVRHLIRLGSRIGPSHGGAGQRFPLGQPRERNPAESRSGIEEQPAAGEWAKPALNHGWADHRALRQFT